MTEKKKKDIKDFMDALEKVKDDEVNKPSFIKSFYAEFMKKSAKKK